MGDDRADRDELGDSAIEIPAGVPREVLAEAIAQLEREDPVYQADFQALYGRRWQRWPRAICVR